MFINEKYAFMCHGEYLKINKLLEFSSIVKIKVVKYFMGFLLNQTTALGASLYFPLKKKPGFA